MNTKLTPDDIKDIFRWRAEGETFTGIVERLKRERGVEVGKTTISDVLTGKRNLPVELSPPEVTEIHEKRKQILTDSLTVLDTQLKLLTTTIIAPLLETIKAKGKISKKDIDGLLKSVDKITNMVRILDRTQYPTPQTINIDQRQINIVMEQEWARTMPLLCDGCKKRLLAYERQRLEGDDEDVVDVESETEGDE